MLLQAKQDKEIRFTISETCSVIEISRTIIVIQMLSACSQSSPPQVFLDKYCPVITVDSDSAEIKWENLQQRILVLAEDFHAACRKLAVVL